MKKYYYITLIAMVATVCLQISYMFSLYNQDVSEDIINIGEVTKKIIEDEKWIRSDLRIGAVDTNENLCLKVKIIVGHDSARVRQYS